MSIRPGQTTKTHKPGTSQVTLKTVSFLIALIALTAIPGNVRALSMPDAEIILDQLLARYPVELLETPLYSENSDRSVTVTLPSFRQQTNGFPPADHIFVQNAQIRLSQTDMPGLTMIDLMLPKNMVLRTADNQITLKLDLGDHDIRIRWNRNLGEPQGLAVKLTRLLADSASRLGPHITLNDIALDWTLDRITLQTGVLTSQYLLGLRGVRVNGLDLLMAPSPDQSRKTHMDFSARGLDLDLPLSPENADIKTVIEGMSWMETNQLLSDAVDNWFLGQTTMEVGQDLSATIGDRLRDAQGRIIFDRIALTAPQISLEGTGEIVMDETARFGLTAEADLILTGKPLLQSLLGTPDNPSFLGALFPFAVVVLARGYPHETGEITGERYVFDLGRNGTLILNGEAIHKTR